MNTRQKVLEDALKCVNGEREKQYGNPEDNFRRIAKRWSLYLTELYEDEGVVIELDPIDVARMMIEFKLARANGPKDKLDNYIDMIGYSACAAEIFENSNEDKTDEYAKNPYSYYHDKLSHYVYVKAKEEHISLENLKDINREFPRELFKYLDLAATDCVIYGKKVRDCYEEIDELFEKYRPDIFTQKFMKACNSSWEAYANVSDYITSSSRKADVNPVDVVNRLVENEHAPTAMANLLMAGKLGFDDIAADIEDAINEVKKENEK